MTLVVKSCSLPCLFTSRSSSTLEIMKRMKSTTTTATTTARPLTHLRQRRKRRGRNLPASVLGGERSYEKCRRPRRLNHRRGLNPLHPQDPRPTYPWPDGTGKPFSTTGLFPWTKSLLEYGEWVSRWRCGDHQACAFCFCMLLFRCQARSPLLHSAWRLEKTCFLEW